ncbi:MAG: hypothetical protein QOH81_2228 [Sphingomonadales bacterium]|jgi:hypothetical protein|nr:hypothetical protein [Sphingomonadales bacterium]
MKLFALTILLAATAAPAFADPAPRETPIGTDRPTDRSGIRLLSRRLDPFLRKVSP